MLWEIKILKFTVLLNLFSHKGLQSPTAGKPTWQRSVERSWERACAVRKTATVSHFGQNGGNSAWSQCKGTFQCGSQACSNTTLWWPAALAAMLCDGRPRSWTKSAVSSYHPFQGLLQPFLLDRCFSSWCIKGLVKTQTAELHTQSFCFHVAQGIGYCWSKDHTWRTTILC